MKTQNVAGTLGIMDARLPHVACPCYQTPPPAEGTIVPLTRRTGVAASPGPAAVTVVQFPGGTDDRYLDGSLRLVGNTGDETSTVQVVSSVGEFASTDLAAGELGVYYLMNERWTGGKLGGDSGGATDVFYPVGITHTHGDNSWVTLTLDGTPTGPVPQMPLQTTWALDCLLAGRDLADQNVTWAYRLGGCLVWNTPGTVTTVEAQSQSEIIDGGGSFSARFATNGTGGLLVQVARGAAPTRTVKWQGKVWLAAA